MQTLVCSLPLWCLLRSALCHLGIIQVLVGFVWGSGFGQAGKTVVSHVKTRSYLLLWV